MKKLFLLFIFFGSLNTLKSQFVTLKINNKTGYAVHEINLPEQTIRSLEIDKTIIIDNLKNIIVVNDLSYKPLFFGNGTIYNKDKGNLEDFPTYIDPRYFDTLRNCEVEYDLRLWEYEGGYKLHYKFVNIIRKPEKGLITNKYAGEYYPINKEGDKLPAICKEGILKINDDNTFSYILIPDKKWCPEMKEFTYEGSCEVKNDILYLYNKEFKTPAEPRFSIMDVDTGNTILISLFSETGEPITIESAHSINSAQRSANLNQLNIPVKKNIIEVKDKRIFGLTIYPFGYPEVQIVLKKIRASAKINIILSATYYDSVFIGRKFILDKNILTEVDGDEDFTDHYIKN